MQCLPITTLADLHKVIDLGALADRGAFEPGPIDRRVGADLHVVTDRNRPDLRDLLVAAATNS